MILYCTTNAYIPNGLIIAYTYVYLYIDIYMYTLLVKILDWYTLVCPTFWLVLFITFFTQAARRDGAAADIFPPELKQ